MWGSHHRILSGSIIVIVHMTFFIVPDDTTCHMVGTGVDTRVHKEGRTPSSFTTYPLKYKCFNEYHKW